MAERRPYELTHHNAPREAGSSPSQSAELTRLRADVARLTQERDEARDGVMGLLPSMARRRGMSTADALEYLAAYTSDWRGYALEWMPLAARTQQAEAERDALRARVERVEQVSKVRGRMLSDYRAVQVAVMNAMPSFSSEAVVEAFAALISERDAQAATIARLLGVLKEYEEADVNDGIMQSQLKAANERADALYRQYEANRDDEELQARRRENLDDCLRLADVASQARRRKQAARQAIKAALIDAALAKGQDG